MLAVLFICQDPAHCFLQFPCNSAEWFHALVTAGSTKPSSSWGLHRSTGGGEHLKPLREVKYKISWPLEAQQSPKISSLGAVSCSSPVQELSALSSVTVRLTEATKTKRFPLLLLQGNGSEGGGEDSGKKKPEN